MEQDKGLRTTVHSSSWHLPYRQEKRQQDSFLRDFLSPFLLTKFFQCPNSSGGAGWREESGEIKKTPVCPLFLLSLYTLPDQGYHKHYIKSSNECTKNKSIMINKNKKQKHAIKPLETLHCLCRWPYRFKWKNVKSFVLKTYYAYCHSCQGKLGKVLHYSKWSIGQDPTALLFIRERLVLDCKASKSNL